MLEDLITAWNHQGLPEDFYNDEVRPMMNMSSGYVFLTNSEYQVAMMNGDKLESWYSCPECGHEGFLEDMQHDGDRDCQEYLESSSALACLDIGEATVTACMSPGSVAMTRPQLQQLSKAALIDIILQQQALIGQLQARIEQQQGLIEQLQAPAAELVVG